MHQFIQSHSDQLQNEIASRVNWRQPPLTATLIAAGLANTEQAAFDYGIQLPDLVPGLPWAEPGGVVTRTLAAWVANHGDSTAATTTARFYDGDPDGGGGLIGTAVVPGLAAGAQAMVSVDWDIQGQGGDHDLFVRVDPVTEFDEENNVAGTAVSLPTFTADLTLTPTALFPGSSVTANVHLTNLQAGTPLSITAVLEILSPMGKTVYTQIWDQSLNGSQEQWLNTSWTSPITASTGGYLVRLSTWDSNNTQQEIQLFFTIESKIGFEIYLPIILSSNTAMNRPYFEPTADISTNHAKYARKPDP